MDETRIRTWLRAIRNEIDKINIAAGNEAVDWAIAVKVQESISRDNLLEDGD